MTPTARVRLVQLFQQVRALTIHDASRTNRLVTHSLASGAEAPSERNGESVKSGGIVAAG